MSAPAMAPGVAPRSAEMQGSIVHGVIYAADVPAAEAALDGRDVLLVKGEGDLAAVVDSAGTVVSAEDTEALARLAVRHEAVLEALLPVASVLPLRLGAAVRGRADAELLLAGQADPLRRALDRIAGCTEWSARAWIEADELAGSLARPPEETGPRSSGESPPPAPGRRYLLERRRAREESAAVDGLLRQHAESIASDLAEVAREALPAGPGQPMESGRLLLDFRLLVPRGDEELLYETLSRSVERRGVPGLRARLTGPWPPYHFVGET